jgi:hypothetical protein
VARGDATSAVIAAREVAGALTLYAGRVLKLRVTYHRAADFAADDEAQFCKGGLLVRVPPPADLELFSEVALEIVRGAARATLRAQVVQTAPHGIAVMFDRAALAALAAGTANRDADPVHEIVDAATETATATTTSGPNIAKRIQQALHGNRDERTAILRDLNKQLHGYVLRNPQLGLDEVLALAKMSTMSGDILAQVAARADWIARPEIALALIRNPKTPTAAAIKLLDRVNPADLRQLAKDTQTRTPIQQAARKKII